MKCLLLAAAAAGFAIAGNAHAQSMQTEFQNESLTVLRIRLAPGEKTPMHDITPRLVVWLTDARLKDTAADGTVREERWKAGQTVWLTARRHAGENLGERAVEFIAILPRAQGPASH